MSIPSIGRENYQVDRLNASSTTASAREVEIEFRPALDEDIPAIQALLNAYVSQKKLLRRTRQELAMLATNGFVATVDEEVVGFAAVEIYSRKLGEIQCLAVSEEYQGQGIGSKLVELCVERARERGILEVMAISSSEHFLRKLGFDYSLPDQKRALFFQLRSRDDYSNESVEPALREREEDRAGE